MSDLELPEFPDEDWFERFEHAPPEQAYGDLDELLDRAELEGVLDLPAESAELARSGVANRVRVAVIAERLWLLGYLAKRADAADPADLERWNRFLAAVERFQRDANLVADRWVGELTWRALQQLVSFETPTDVRRHSDAESPRPALIRAVRLRLWALGLLAERPTAASKSDVVPLVAMRRFWLLVRRLGMVPFETKLPPVLDCFEWIFDQNRLVEGAARSSTPDPNQRRRRAFKYLGVRDERKTVDPQVRRFIVCLVKVEFWLLGFDVDIDGKADYLVYGFEADRGVRRNRALRRALRQFWKNIRRTTPARQRAFAERITPELLEVLADPPGSRAGGALPPVGDYSHEASDVIRGTRQIDQAWKEGRSLGMRLWDGLGRVWRWLSRGARQVLSIGKNLLRGFFRYALKAFEIVRFSARVVAQSISQYVAGELNTGERTSVHVALTVDADFSIEIAQDAPGDHLQQVGLGIRYFGHAFLLACRILALIADVIRDAATGAVGWARLIWDLVRGYRAIRPIYRQVRAMPRPLWA